MVEYGNPKHQIVFLKIYHTGQLRGVRLTDTYDRKFNMVLIVTEDPCAIPTVVNKMAQACSLTLTACIWTASLHSSQTRVFSGMLPRGNRSRPVLSPELCLD